MLTVHNSSGLRNKDLEMLETFDSLNDTRWQRNQVEGLHFA